MIYEVTLSEIYEVEALTPTDAICKAHAKQAKGELGNYSTANAKATKSGRWLVDMDSCDVTCSNCGVSYHPSDLGIISDDEGKVPFCPMCGCRNEGKINGRNS